MKKMVYLVLLLAGQCVFAKTSNYFDLFYGEVLAESTEQVGLWWASSGWKISQGWINYSR